MATTPTHIIRFIAEEDHRVHLGQLVDTTRDVGLDSVQGHPIKAYLINGTIFDGQVQKDQVLTVKQLLSPVAPEQCSYIRCLGLNYVDHAHEAKMDLPKVPILFTKPRTSLADPFPAVIPIPRFAQDGTSDYEAELCVVIGKTGRNISEEAALDYVLGYTCANDVSARTAQMITSQWCFSKGLDGSCPLGPVLVTKGVIGDPAQGLGIKAIYNGETLQDGNTKNMIFNIKKTVSYLSQGTTLEAGTIILTGTPDGIGFARNPRVTLEDGSDIRVWIEKIGTLVNRVKFESW
ncbi:5-carboxymethyl-2-hydroxymuconate isomerase [Xylogone sp. PMI_703]|nr:5-carboxymethyl-2-hydroxymuconate isomerase [Xylogone sp. PMI_703]